MTKIILAVQAETLQKAKKIYRRTQGWVDVYKIGIDLFTHSGVSSLNFFVKQKEEVFLDLKFCDIPSIVAKALLSGAKLGARMFTIHVMGGKEMMKRAKEALDEFARKKHLKTRPLIFGVTILTSIAQDEFQILWGKKDLTKEVLYLATLAKDAGLDGVVCSAHEVALIKRECGKDFLTVVPGIRVTLPETEIIERRKVIVSDDQSRYETPIFAAQAGADYIVVGRQVINAIDPIAVLEKIRNELKR
jgi:orotidine-5'-phosphate decarboxylase